jgi:DNA processing protein
MSTQTQRDRLAPLIRLNLCPGVGAVTFANLLDYFGSAEAALEASESALQRVPGLGPATARGIVTSRDAVDVDGELALIEQHNIRLISQRDKDYPYPLRHISDPPPLLYVQGELLAADAVSIAIVGSRRCSRYGFEQAERFAHLLARAGFTVISGMARGIDGAAHNGALAGGGRTIAVLGCGLANTYPPEHKELRERIVGRGAVISEFPMRVEPEGKNFPRRNRIIAGLTLATVVVEAAGRSGALITARLANEYGREVFAVPGRIDSPFSQGPHALIRDGAKLIQCLDDILDELGEVGSTIRPEGVDPLVDDAPMVKLDEDEQKLMDALGDEPAGVEDISRATQLAIPRVMGLLTQLQLKSQVSQLPGQMFIRRSRKKQ